jgi:hypothetical protein
MSVGYFADLFDLINVRDLDLINQARDGCAHLVLGVYTDDYAEERLGHRPVVPLSERMALLRHVRGVAEVVADDGTGRRAGSADVRFVAVDRPDLSARVAVRLWPQRESASALLQRVLRPAATAVA